MQAVPTSVVVGPDRQYYVSQLTGFPFPPGGANVFRVNPRTGAVSVVASGFTNIMPGGITVGKDGLYVTNNAGSPGGGQVLRIRAR
jgi:hypothetical protein